MHPTESALLRAIVEDPYDDAARYAIADHWEETGNSARAEFVRVQMELAHPTYQIRVGMTTHDGHSLTETFRNTNLERLYEEVQRHRYLSGRIGTLNWQSEVEQIEDHDLRDRKRELLEQYGHDWIGEEWGAVINRSPELTVPKGWDNQRYVFRRGFVEHVTLTLRDWCGDVCRGMVGCAGSGFVETPNLRLRCQSCNGTGRVNAYGPQIVAEAPILEVVLSDVHALHLLPMCIQALLPIYPGSTLRGDVVSRALIVWARRIAVLPPLKAPGQATVRPAFPRGRS